MNKSTNYFDVIVVGAGLSGIGAAHYIQKDCPGKTYAILEMRNTIGGTWDLFRYPGIRSDSDMYTLGYAFRPWESPKAIADGPSILEYIRKTAKEEAIDQHIRYHHKIKRASWSSAEKLWTIGVERTDTNEIIEFTCNFLLMCSGYYNYDHGYMPNFAGQENFKGQIVHPQKWTEDIDYTNKKVVVIGSGATAVTLVPALARKAARVVMLQRSPTYIVSAPSEDKIANFFRKILPLKLAYHLTRWKNIVWTLFFYNLARKKPNFVKRLFRTGTQKALGPDYDVAKHFSPKYNPWDERLCLVPDGDLFISIRKGKAEIVTDHIEQFTESGILLKSGKTIDTDLIVSATGLEIKFMADLQLTVDGKKIEGKDLYVYRGTMFSNVPNLALIAGYTNASWTLKSDLSSQFICRIINRMHETGKMQVVPRLNENLEEIPLIDFSSGYIQRAKGKLPKQGTKSPWKLYQNYVLDVFNLKYTGLEDNVLEFK
jgi:monooxygenase